MTDDERKAWIDAATYRQLLTRWRFAGAGDPFFIGEVGKHYSKVMAEKKAALGPGEAAAISKRVGW